MSKFHVVHMKKKGLGEDWKPVGGSKVYLDADGDRMEGDLEYMKNFGPENEYKTFTFETPINSDGDVFSSLVPDCLPDDIMEDVDGNTSEVAGDSPPGAPGPFEADQPPGDDEPGEDDALV